jgi:hypothetical protein
MSVVRCRRRSEDGPAKGTRFYGRRLSLTESQNRRGNRTAPRFDTLTIRAFAKGGAHGSFSFEQ